MAEVKWIKIVTDIFDDEKILMIETLPECDTIIVIWFKLLCLAGKKNNCGVFQMGHIPYTDEMFATIFRRPLNTVRLALQTFEQFGMVEIVNNTVTIPNWGRHQSLDAYEKRKERDRLYQAERRAAQRALAEKSSDKSPDKSSYVAPLE
jgi:predicted phage replisome organizer